LNTLLFIHGNGQTFEDMACIATELAARYRINVLSIDWATSHSTGDYDLDRQSAQKAGVFFSPLVRDVLLRFQVSDVLSQKQIVLLAHSMGNFILETIVVDWKEALVGPQPAAIILSAPDVFLKGHELWIERLGVRRSGLYVMANQCDLALGTIAKTKCKGFFKGFLQTVVHASKGITSSQARLGNSPKPKPAASNAIYLEVPKEIAGNRHEYYVSSSHSGDPPPRSVERFLSAVFASTGQPIDLAKVGLRGVDQNWTFQ
jgi:hypothetical protein